MQTQNCSADPTTNSKTEKTIQVDLLKDCENSGFVVSELVVGPGEQIMNIKKCLMKL